MASLFSVDPGWKLILHDLGLTTEETLRIAQLPADLFDREYPVATAKQFFDLWNAVESQVTQPDFYLLAATAISVESFSPPLFAALCSNNFETGIYRLQKYKKLCGPLQINIQKEKSGISLTFGSTTTDILPDSYQIIEVLFLLNLIRTATRQQHSPVYVESPLVDELSPATKKFLNCELRQAMETKVLFDQSVTQSPFLSENKQMWQFFEPQLNSNLRRYESSVPMHEQVTSLLLNLIPAGKTNIEEVANQLCMSKRTLQRKLSDEKQNFQSLLADTRKKLAIHYLKRSSYSNTEISFLLGFDDPNSFIRAFSNWVGTSPESYRSGETKGI